MPSSFSSCAMAIRSAADFFFSSVRFMEATCSGRAGAGTAAPARREVGVRVSGKWAGQRRSGMRSDGWGWLSAACRIKLAWPRNGVYPWADAVLEGLSASCCRGRRPIATWTGRRPWSPRLAVAEQHQRGNAADAVLGRRILILVHIQLADLDAIRVFRGDFVQDRRDHPAGAAPFGPVIHQDRLLGLAVPRLQRISSVICTIRSLTEWLSGSGVGIGTADRPRGDLETWEPTRCDQVGRIPGISPPGSGRKKSAAHGVQQGILWQNNQPGHKFLSLFVRPKPGVSMKSPQPPAALGIVATLMQKDHLTPVPFSSLGLTDSLTGKPGGCRLYLLHADSGRHPAAGAQGPGHRRPGADRYRQDRGLPASRPASSDGNPRRRGRGRSLGHHPGAHPRAGGADSS